MNAWLLNGFRQPIRNQPGGSIHSVSMLTLISMAEHPCMSLPPIPDCLEQSQKQEQCLDTVENLD
ncbi:hypothetical protein [Polaromonas sp. CG_23.6]|uniref:hypothetical protein n=1 Tax=Polaromonas sp. CG_23.6 TaxID=2760709 RepID=UPI0024766B1C|nr:hypothetical protein [Polaromonas sp. CG_23.6]MDH6184088.1 hypothetical protein [Polaromonas sp. CG_23.6]